MMGGHDTSIGTTRLLAQAISLSLSLGFLQFPLTPAPFFLAIFCTSPRSSISLSQPARVFLSFLPRFLNPHICYSSLHPCVQPSILVHLLSYARFLSNNGPLCHLLLCSISLFFRGV